MTSYLKKVIFIFFLLIKDQISLHVTDVFLFFLLLFIFSKFKDLKSIALSLIIIIIYVL